MDAGVLCAVVCRRRLRAVAAGFAGAVGSGVVGSEKAAPPAKSKAEAAKAGSVLVRNHSERWNLMLVLPGTDVIQST